jgi:protein-S-isoprenylcysteine O-methyltransferase Ste14
LLAANWFMLAVAYAAFPGIAGPVIPRKEAELVQKSGDEYRKCMERTGRFAPRLHLFQ